MKTFTEYINESFTVKAGLQGALIVNGKDIAKVVKHGRNVFIMIDKKDGDKNRLLVPGGKDMLSSEIVDWFTSYLKKNPKVLSEDLEEAYTLSGTPEEAKKAIDQYMKAIQGLGISKEIVKAGVDAIMANFKKDCKKG